MIVFMIVARPRSLVVFIAIAVVAFSLAALGFSTPAWAAKIKVVATVPDLAEIAARIGGGEVEATSLLDGSEDPHFIDAVPSFVLKAADADVVCAMGLELESAWLPRVLSKSGNAKVQKGSSGYCDASRGVETLDKPSGAVDRSSGDVHPGGNPHYNLSPKALAQAALPIADALSAARPEKAAAFQKASLQFRGEMDALQARIQKKLEPAIERAGGKPLALEYHKEFAYFFALYGIKSLGAIEEKPGVPPSAARLAQVAAQAKASGAKVALASLHGPDRHLRRFSELSGLPAAKLPTLVQKTRPGCGTIEKAQDAIADAILAAAGAGQAKAPDPKPREKPKP